MLCNCCKQNETNNHVTNILTLCIYFLQKKHAFVKQDQSATIYVSVRARNYHNLITKKAQSINIDFGKGLNIYSEPFHCPPPPQMFVCENVDNY